MLSDTSTQQLCHIQAIQYDDTAEMTHLFTIFEIGDEGVYCSLGVIPMVALGSILKDKSIILREVNCDQQFSMHQAIFAFLVESRLLLSYETVRS